MITTLSAILAIGSQVVTQAPEVVDIIETAIAAFKANDQASLDAAHASAVALANSLAPAGA